jgi:DNA-binding transcriptional ArsR family regulator
MSIEDSKVGQPGQAAQDDPALPELRKVSDAQALRALAHPVRLALYEALTLGGAMTATEAGEAIGESPTTCSFHLRQLAKYGFVEEAGGGKGRARPWRLTSIGMELTSAPDDPEARTAKMALVRMLDERSQERYRTWLETSASYPQRWQLAAGDSDYLFYLTIEELEQLQQELAAMLMPRFLERLTDPSKRPAGAVPVYMRRSTFPLAMPSDAGQDG